jgi:hypothetical protein
VLRHRQAGPRRRELMPRNAATSIDGAGAGFGTLSREAGRGTERVRITR